ncbi:hypothetical protein [Tahibacter soli]|uniref:Uncharacterized protein n=1 Tax=Tahibacter soli TaxID=2983605 RepID=A0A9X3YKX2_9GAMM|nr:hypothetical protein [Tahibacter soli]MDC8012608.1 hypothetical protein [Tahibacter soli]
MKPPAARRDRTPSTARIGAIVWPSFFAAGVATTVFFAVVDPLELAAITWARLPVTRGAGYTLGFFMFWSCTLASSAFTAWLSTGAPRRRGGLR